MANVAQRAPVSARQKPDFRSFLVQTTPISKQISDLAFVNQNEQKSVDLDRVGYLAYAQLFLIGTITTGVGAAGTFDANYWPYNLLSRIRAESNTGYIHYNTSGFDNYLVQRFTRMGFDPGTTINPLSAYSGVKGSRNAFATTFNATTNAIVTPGTAIAASTTYKVMVPYMIPFVAFGDLRTGLIPVQNAATKVSIYATMGNIVDWLGSTGALGTGGAISFTMRTMEQLYSIPDDPLAQPFAPGEGYLHRIITDRYPWSASGDNETKIPVNGIIARAMMNFKVAQAANAPFIPQQFFTTAGALADPSLPLFNNIKVQYAASQLPENYRFEHLLYWTRQLYGTDFPDGTLLFDFATGSSVEAGIAIEGLYNTRRITEFLVGANSSVTPAVNSVIDVTRQELQLLAA